MGENSVDEGEQKHAELEHRSKPQPNTDHNEEAGQFIASDKWTGSKTGYKYQLGRLGLGYYWHSPVSEEVFNAVLAGDRRMYIARLNGDDDWGFSTNVTQDGMTLANLRVTCVDPDSQATNVGIRAGDKLISVNGTPVDENNIEEILYYLTKCLAVDILFEHPVNRHCEKCSGTGKVASARWKFNWHTDGMTECWACRGTKYHTPGLYRLISTSKKRKTRETTSDRLCDLPVGKEVYVEKVRIVGDWIRGKLTTGGWIDLRTVDDSSVCALKVENNSMFEESAYLGLIEERGMMPVTAYMHKSLASKLSLTERSTLNKWAMDGWKEADKTEYKLEKFGWIAGGFLASAFASPFTGIAALGGYLWDNSTQKGQDTITFYWKECGLWCKLPASYLVDTRAVDGPPHPEEYYQVAKVKEIEGNFEKQEIIVRFTKTRGNQTACDRVIDISSDYTNLKETLLWIRENQGDKYLDRSVQQILECNEDDGRQCSICHGEGTVPCQQSECMEYRWGRSHPCLENKVNCKKVCRACGGINFTSYNDM